MGVDNTSRNIIFVHPELIRFHKSAVTALLFQLRLFSIAISLWCLLDTIFAFFYGNYFCLLALSIFVGSFWLTYTFVNKVVPGTLNYCHYISGAFLWTVLLSSPSILVLPLTYLYREAIVSIFSDISIIFLSVAFVLGLGSVVYSLFDASFLQLSRVLVLPVKSGNSVTVGILFIALFLLSSIFVFYFFGEYLWDFTLDLLSSSSFYDLIFLLLYSLWYLITSYYRDLSLPKSGF